MASHVRENGRRYVTDPKHMPAAHRAHAEWSPQRMVGWAAELSPKAGQVAPSILRSAPHPELGYRACLAGPDPVGQALRAGALHRRLRARPGAPFADLPQRQVILEHALDQTPLSVAVLPDPPEHENLRGGAYYADADSAREA